MFAYNHKRVRRGMPAAARTAESAMTIVSPQRHLPPSIVLLAAKAAAVALTCFIIASIAALAITTTTITMTMMKMTVEAFSFDASALRSRSSSIASGSSISSSITRRSSTRLKNGLPSWDELERRLPTSLIPGPAVYFVDDDDFLLPTTDASSSSLSSLSTLLKSKGNKSVVLYRDRNGWCPYCEQAWLTLEVKGIDYITVLVDVDESKGKGKDDVGDKDDCHSYYDDPGSYLPRVCWPDGTVHEGRDDMLPIMERSERERPGVPVDLFPDVSASVDIVRMSIERRFDGVMPRFTIPSGTAPYVFRIADKDSNTAKENGEENGGNKKEEKYDIVPKFKYQVTLEEIEEILEEYDDGPYIAGKTVTAADIFWAPFLERFAAHLPLLYEGIDPKSAQYGAVRDWYDAMDVDVPSYSCLVKGRIESWRRVLRTRHPNLSVASGISSTAKTTTMAPAAANDNDNPRNLPTGKKKFDARKVWSRYAAGRQHVAGTPEEEVAARIVSRRDDVVAAVIASSSAKTRGTTSSFSSRDEVDAALRELCNALVSLGRGGRGGTGGGGNNNNEREGSAVAAVASKLSGDARDVAAFLDGDDGIVGFWESPRDVGVIPAEALRALVKAAPKPRI